MTALPHLLKKEFTQLRRNAFLPRLILLFPVMVVCVIPWVMDMEVKGVGISLVDHDNSTLSRRLAGRLDSSPSFRLKAKRSSSREALADIEQGTADIVIEVPPHYERQLRKGSPTPVLVAANAVNGTKGSLGASYATSVIAQNHPASPATAQPRFGTLNLYNPHLRYKPYMIPALLSILIMMLCGFLPALNIVGEKEAGTIEQINVTPVSKASFTLAKLIPYWLIALLTLTVCLLLTRAIYGIAPAGSVGLLYLTSTLLALVFSGLGLAVSNYSDTMQQAIFVMWFLVVCMMLLSGIFTPISSMPSWAQRLTLALPVRYYVDAVRTVFLRAGTLRDILPQTLALSLFALALNAWAVASYRKKD